MAGWPYAVTTRLRCSGGTLLRRGLTGRRCEERLRSSPGCIMIMTTITLGIATVFGSAEEASTRDGN